MVTSSKKHNAEGYVWTAAQRQNLSKASLKREATIRQKISVNGFVYPNLTYAAKALGVSARTIKRWATNGIPEQSARNGNVSKNLLNAIHVIYFVQRNAEHGS